jgi:hypothetical protein
MKNLASPARALLQALTAGRSILFLNYTFGYGVIVQKLTELLSSAVQAAHYRPDRDSHRFGYIFVAEFFDRPEQQDHLILGRELI